MALGFRSGLVGLIKSNRRRSKATSRIWRLKSGQRRPEDEMQECNGYCVTDPKGLANWHLPMARPGDWHQYVDLALLATPL